jgi:hypothetical protein
MVTFILAVGLAVTAWSMDMSTKVKPYVDQALAYGTGAPVPRAIETQNP